MRPWKCSELQPCDHQGTTSPQLRPAKHWKNEAEANKVEYPTTTA
jgi:hypothetical protein